MKITRRQLRELILNEHWVGSRDGTRSVKHDWIVGDHKHVKDEEWSQGERESEEFWEEWREKKDERNKEKRDAESRRKIARDKAKAKEEKLSAEEAKKNRWWNRLDWGLTIAAVVADLFPGGQLVSLSLAPAMIATNLKAKNYLGAGLSIASILPVTGGWMKMFGKSAAEGTALAPGIAKSLGKALNNLADRELLDWLGEFLPEHSKNAKKIESAIKRFANKLLAGSLSEAKTVKLNRKDLRELIREELELSCEGKKASKSKGKPYKGSRRGKTESQAQQKAAGIALSYVRKHGKKAAMRNLHGAPKSMAAMSLKDLEKLATIRRGSEVPDSTKTGYELAALPGHIKKKS